MLVENNLARLGISLPPPPRPVGSYVPAKQAGNLMFLSGVLPFKDGKIVYPGKLGRELSVAEGKEAARIALINALAVLHQELGDLGRIRSIVRLTGHVASVEGFVEQPSVLNGASDLLVDLFREAGRHARVALGAFELPLHAPVELELIVEFSPRD